MPPQPQAFVNATTAASSANVASGSVAWPSTTNGDAVLLVVCIGSTTPTIALPTNFTQLVAQTDAGTVCRTRTFWYVCNGSESGSIAISWTGGSTSFAAAAAAYRGVSTITPVDQSSGTGNAGGTSRGSQNVTQTRTAIPIHAWCESNSTGVQSYQALPAPLTQRAFVCSSATQFVSVLIADDNGIFGPGAQTNRTVTLNVSSTNGTAYGLDFNPRVDSLASPDLANGVKPSSIKLYAAAAPLTGQLWPRGAVNR